MPGAVMKRLLQSLPTLSTTKESTVEAFGEAMGLNPSNLSSASASPLRSTFRLFGPPSPYTLQSGSSTPIPFADHTLGRFDTHQKIRAVLGCDTPAAAIPLPTKDEIMRYRYQHGIALDGIFLLRRALFPQLFVEGAEGDEEIDAVKAHVKLHGIERTREVWEDHWEHTMTNNDWEWLKFVAKVTAVKVPVGCCTLGEVWCKGTEFEPVAAVYRRAWKCFKKFVKIAASWDIAVIIVLHPLAESRLRVPMPWPRADSDMAPPAPRYDFTLYTRCLTFIANCVATSASLQTGIAGLQVFGKFQHCIQNTWAYYTAVLAAINNVNPTLPIYLMEALSIGETFSFVREEMSNPYVNSDRLKNIIIIDTQGCYSHLDMKNNGTGIAADASSAERKPTEATIERLGMCFGRWNVAPKPTRPRIKRTDSEFVQMEKHRTALAKLHPLAPVGLPFCTGTFFKTYSSVPPGKPAASYREALNIIRLPAAPPHRHVSSATNRILSGTILDGIEAPKAIDLSENLRTIYIQAYYQAIKDACVFWDWNLNEGPGADVFGGPFMEVAWARKRWIEYATRGGLNERKAFIDGFLLAMQDWRRSARHILMKDADLGLLTVQIPSVTGEDLWFGTVGSEQ